MSLPLILRRKKKPLVFIQADSICVSDTVTYNAILLLERLQNKERKSRYRTEILMGHTELRKTTALES